MRISTQQIQQTAINALLRQQAELSNTQNQLALGKRVITPSDDPVASANLLNLEQELEVTKQYQFNANMAKSRLGQEETALTAVTNQIHRVRELAIQASNATYTDEDRKMISAEARHILDELFDMANSKDSNNEYLFSGYKGDIKPFDYDGLNYIYNGDDGQRSLKIGASRTIADGDPGSKVFMNIRTGNGTFRAYDDPANIGAGVINGGTVTDNALYDRLDYTISFANNSAGDLVYLVNDDSAVIQPAWVQPPTGLPDDAPLFVSESSINFGRGVSVSISGTPDVSDTFKIVPSPNQDFFTTLESFADALEAGTMTVESQAKFNNAMNRTLYDIDLALDNFLNVRAEIGARLNAIESQESINDDFKIQIESFISTIQDLDYAEAISRFNLQQAGLQAAQQSYVQIQGLSLFNYL